MKSMRNKVQLIGNLGINPEMMDLQKGQKLAKFSLATNESYYNASGDKITDTQWHQLVAWGKVAERVEKLLKKGTEVAIEGKLVNRSYEDKAGNKRYITEVVVNDFLLLGGKKETN
ncbi:MAG: single-stranded DNA-binding protein [Flavobacteriales bacterium]|nr:single-stranded DNA-binding protein [Flavobacteriales bacterium]